MPDPRVPGPPVPDETHVPTVVVLGGGPRGVGWLERFVANRLEFGDAPVHIDIVDPFPVGPGRLWRYDQSPLLKLNSLAEDVTMFTDESSTAEGPVDAGPSLAEWARDARAGLIPDATAADLDPDLAAELHDLGPKSFPTRRLQSLYLDWFHRRTLGRLPAGTTVTAHLDRAASVDDLPDGRQEVRLASGETLVADVVVYTLGHSASDAPPEHQALVSFADRHGLAYLPPSFTADTDLSAFEPGEPVLVRGFGLAAVDLLVLLGEGRGGRFERDGGRVRYRPSGREPRILIGSRRGVPYHSKITSTLVGERPEPRYFTPAIAQEIAGAHPRLDFLEHVFPAVAKELLHGYYAELFTGHPERVAVSWESFRDRFDAVDPFGDDLRRLAAETVLDPADRLDLEAFDRPLTALRGLTRAEVQDVLREYIRDDLARRTLPEHSATLGLFQSLLGAFGAVLSILDSPNWTALSRERDLGGGWLSYFSYIASGPPGPRLEEILALSEAGVVTFLGAGLTIEASEDARAFVARTTTSDEVVTTRALVDAWLPSERVGTSENPALRSLVESGAALEQVVADASHTSNTGKLPVDPASLGVVLADGSVHPRRFALGPYTTSPFVGAFSRPRTNALSFRQNDAVARAVLARLASVVPASA
ncbi:FAD/NAD(P)-binding protein [Frondihabitans cladoniiphilus]|uniref:FAD/NAD(P)-binding protein n=1 Tax=Frondihabitans cladoniiphilus TaxID=715785 RepID=UPI0031EC0254